MLQQGGAGGGCRLRSGAGGLGCGAILCLKMMDFVLKMMDFAFKTRNCESSPPSQCDLQRWCSERSCVCVFPQVDLPLMTHHTFSSVPLSECPGRLRPGDIYTHCLHGFESTLITADGVHEAATAARARGVIFDIGHG